MMHIIAAAAETEKAINWADIISVIVAALNFMFLIFISVYGIVKGKLDTKNKKMEAWYSSEIFKRDKIEEYYKALEIISNSKDISVAEKCMQIDEAVTEFSFNVIDYSKIISDEHCLSFKKNVILAVDELMIEIVSNNNSDKYISKLIRKHRMSFLKMFFEKDILGELGVK